MECTMLSIATGFLQRSWLWFYMMCPTESSLGFFLDVITFLQSFIFTETTKENLLYFISFMHPLSFIPSLVSLFSCFLQLSSSARYHRGLGETMWPHAPDAQSHGKMESSVFVCVIQNLWNIFGEWNSPTLQISVSSTFYTVLRNKYVPLSIFQ